LDLFRRDDPFSRNLALLDVPWDASQRSLEATVLWLMSPFRELFSRSARLPQFAAALLSALWALAVWAFFGGAITRIAAVELALEERVGLKRALRHAVRKWPAFFAGPLLPLMLMVLLSIPLILLGGILRLDIGVLFAGLVWPLALVCGVVMTLTLVGLAVGWPLMWATIGVDGTDSFDAFGRTYSYVYQRPLNYLFYAVLSLAIGAIGWIVVSTFAALVIHLTAWGVGWGSSEERLRQVEVAAGAGQPLGYERAISALLPGTEPLGAPGRMGANLIGFWTACVRLLAVAFGASFLWTASTGIYLLLRRDADAKELDEIYVEDRPDDSPLPPIVQDAAGVPVLAKTPPENE
jgi:hypothetical protein